jgi:hypothetical protein
MLAFSDGYATSRRMGASTAGIAGSAAPVVVVVGVGDVGRSAGAPAHAVNNPAVKTAPTPLRPIAPTQIILLSLL